MCAQSATVSRPKKAIAERESAIVRFAGDSGDGVQLTGSRFTQAAAEFGNDIATFPDFPAEIRAPVGTTYGVSAYQINFSAHDVSTPGDSLDVLVALNPAALRSNLKDLKSGGLLVIDNGSFSERNLHKAHYKKNPLDDNSLAGYRILSIDISKHTLDVVKVLGLGRKDGLRCKNFWTLGLVYWLFSHDRLATEEFIRNKFKQNPEIAAANVAALHAGHIYGETAELPEEIGSVIIPKAKMEPGLYRNISGAQAIAWGVVAGAHLSGLEAMFASYPITPASAVLHYLAHLGQYGVKTFQAEDEIAAVCAAIGASYAGQLGFTSSSGPGIDLKTEAIALACATELPLVVLNTQRAGPSTGMPTKTEQADLLQSLFGRHGETPLPVIAASTPADCFAATIEACRIALRYMTPVIMLSDGYLANATVPWKIPDIRSFERFDVEFHQQGKDFQPYKRNPDSLARNWAIPGNAGTEHRIGGIEKDYDSGDISYAPENHQKMVQTRAQKVLNIAKDIPEQTVSQGNTQGKLLVLGWGSTFGPIHQAVKQCLGKGQDVAHIHLRYLWPLPRNLKSLLQAYDQVLVTEMNTGQLRWLLQGELGMPLKALNKVTGQPFKIREITQCIESILEAG